MPTRAIMIQGTGSNVGKSMLVAGLCRAATRRGTSDPGSAHAIVTSSPKYLSKTRTSANTLMPSSHLFPQLLVQVF